ncbi:MAG: magnesium transporter CorA family protein [Bacteroidetes bacterium]|nr:MAG: magnesium transporter CorA family protein [Bacteroidota bacterium]
MIKRFNLQNGCLVPAESDDGTIHLYISPDTSERDYFRNTLKIDDHTLSSTLDPDEVSRIEINPENTLLIWKRPTNYSGGDTFYFNVASIGMFLFPERLIIIANDDVQLPTSGGRQTPSLQTPMDFMLTLLFTTIHHYLEHLKVIKMIARDLQQKINTSMENKHLIQMFNLSESLIYYLNGINGNGVVLTRLRNHAEKAGYSANVIAFLDDLIIENNQCYKQAEIYSTVFSGLMDARGSLVNNNMSLLLKNLTIINIVFLPLNLLASIGGMSEFSMMTQHIDWRISYSLFLIAMVVIGWLTAIVLQKLNFGFGVVRTSKRKKKHHGAVAKHPSS